jgi:hypothetical protein
MPETKAGNDKPTSDAVLAERGDDTEREPREQADRDGDHGELDRRWQHQQYFVDDTASAAERLPEIATQDLADEDQILDRYRLVEAELAAQCRKGGGGRLVAEDDGGRIARDEAHQHEDRRQHDEQRRDREQEALEQISDHAAALFAIRRAGAKGAI